MTEIKSVSRSDQLIHVHRELLVSLPGEEALSAASFPTLPSVGWPVIREEPLFISPALSPYRRRGSGTVRGSGRKIRYVSLKHKHESGNDPVQPSVHSTNRVTQQKLRIRFVKTHRGSVESTGGDPLRTRSGSVSMESKVEMNRVQVDYPGLTPPVLRYYTGSS